MNRIKIVEDNVEEVKLSKKVMFTMKPAQNEFDISLIEINILKSCELELELSSVEKKIKVNVEVQKGAEVKLFLYQKLDNSKVQYNYQIGSGANVCVSKFQLVAVGKEMISAHLLGEGATFDYILKDICSGKETLDYYVYHDAKSTNSNIKNNIVSVRNGKMTVQVSTFIPKGMKGSIANQNNRIISLNEKKNEIRPNLYIDEYDVVANHSALIGKFSGEEIFYLQSRGISKEEATRLLLKGFLFSDITNKKMKKEIDKATKQEWR